jgi:hypothetical protein
MSVDERPKGLTATSIFMSITNAMGWAIIDWSKPNARIIFVLFTVTIAINYLVIWFYWKGRNWARILVLLTSLLCLYNLRHWNHGGIAERIMIGAGPCWRFFSCIGSIPLWLGHFFVANLRQMPD